LRTEQKITRPGWLFARERSRDSVALSKKRTRDSKTDPKLGGAKTAASKLQNLVAATMSLTTSQRPEENGQSGRNKSATVTPEPKNSATAEDRWQGEAWRRKSNGEKIQRRRLRRLSTTESEAKVTSDGTLGLGQRHRQQRQKQQHNRLLDLSKNQPKNQ
jgi:hypothetical protein